MTTKKQLTIKQLTKRYVLEEVFEDKNTITYSTETEGENAPQFVGFSVARGVSNAENYTGYSVLSGSVYNGGFQLSTPVTDIEDYALLRHIHCTANALLNKEISLEK